LRGKEVVEPPRIRLLAMWLNHFFPSSEVTRLIEDYDADPMLLCFCTDFTQCISKSARFSVGHVE